MTGQELINWIKENKAEEYEVRMFDFYDNELAVEPYLSEEYVRTKEGKVIYNFIGL